MSGTLFVVATPIGNLGDMVPRAVTILQTVDLIACEDTRHTGRLLTHFSIDKPLVAYHDHSDVARMQRILGTLEEGKQVALVTDAGTPLVSDPGYQLVRLARERGIEVCPIPGACAAIAALSVAGLPSDRFAFEGFLPAKAGARRKRLEGLVGESRTLIFYEAPHRVMEAVGDLRAVFGADREGFLAREISKAFETFTAGTLGELESHIAADANQQRGEMVIIVRGANAVDTDVGQAEHMRVLTLLMAELPLRQAANLAARITGASKNALYQQALALRDGAPEHVDPR